MRSFALVESGTAAAAGSGDVSDSYPLLLTLRAAFDGSDGTFCEIFTFLCICALPWVVEVLRDCLTLAIILVILSC